MIVALDIGNTNLRLGIVRGSDVSSARSALTPKPVGGRELEATLESLLLAEGATLDRIEEIAAVSVVPAVTSALAEIAARRGVPVIVADALNIPIATRVDFPSGVGDDRLVNAFAASRLYGKPAIVIDLGTATTFDVVAADGAFVGGAIAPGVGLGLAALANETAQLPRVVPALPPNPIGRNTIEAIQSGAVLGYVGLVEHLIRAIAAELGRDGGRPPKVILTGGPSIAEWTKAISGVDVVDQLLTLRGLAMVHSEAAKWERIAQL